MVESVQMVICVGRVFDVLAIFKVAYYSFQKRKITFLNI